MLTFCACQHGRHLAAKRYIHLAAKLCIVPNVDAITHRRGSVFCPAGADPMNRSSLGLLYMGALQSSVPHAFGEVHFENGDIYQGEFKGGK
jgi:hypothetical protein